MYVSVMFILVLKRNIRNKRKIRTFIMYHIVFVNIVFLSDQGVSREWRFLKEDYLANLQLVSQKLRMRPIRKRVVHLLIECGVPTQFKRQLADMAPSSDSCCKNHIANTVPRHEPDSYPWVSGHMNKRMVGKLQCCRANCFAIQFYYLVHELPFTSCNNSRPDAVALFCRVGSIEPDPER